MSVVTVNGKQYEVTSKIDYDTPQSYYDLINSATPGDVGSPSSAPLDLNGYINKIAAWVKKNPLIVVGGLGFLILTKRGR